MRLDTRTHRLFDFYWENIDLMPKLLGILLRLTGKIEEARLATLDYRVPRTEFVIPGLPSRFDGYCILHMSDLHIDEIIDGGRALTSTVSSVEFDLCVLTGDYRFDTYGPYEETLEGMTRLLPFLNCSDGVVGILGNHDMLEMLPYLEALGITMLMNEVTTVRRGDQRLWIAGVDDCHYYQVADLHSARAAIPAGAADIVIFNQTASIFPAPECESYTNTPQSQPYTIFRRHIFTDAAPITSATSGLGLSIRAINPIKLNPHSSLRRSLVRIFHMRNMTERPTIAGGPNGRNYVTC
jgi:hypothetical protein